jgi:hypothetical protein
MLGMLVLPRMGTNIVMRVHCLFVFMGLLLNIGASLFFLVS